MQPHNRMQPRRATTAALAAFLLFAALLGVTRADASLPKTADVAELSRPALQLPIASPSEPSLFGFAEDVTLLAPESTPGRFGLFGLETRRFERTYARNNPLRLVDPNGLEPLNAHVRQFLETSYRADLSGVNVFQAGPITGTLLRWFKKGAITFGNRIYMDPGVWGEYKGRTRGGVATTGHEVEHTIQYKHVGGVIPGVLVYGAQWIGAGFSYSNIPWELQAGRADDNILDFLNANSTIAKKLQQGEDLTDDELELVDATFGGDPSRPPTTPEPPKKKAEDDDCRRRDPFCGSGFVTADNVVH